MSSSFLNSIQRENKAKENLQYDDGAFYYFFSAFTLFILVPLGVSLITQLLQNTNKFNINKDAIPTLLGHDVQGYLMKKEKKSKFNKALLYKLLLAIFLVYLYSKLASSSESGKELKGFDPYDILEIPKGTEDQDVIKKQFRKLSIKYHPDRNPDDPNAANKFMLLTKAADCFSDPKKLEKCLNGNPDDEGGFSIGIALPSFLLDKENRVPVLVTFFVVILIIIPYFVLSWYSEVSKYDMDGTLVDDKQLFVAHLNENLIVKNCPKVISVCLEFLPILPVKVNQKQDLLALHTAVNEHIGKVQLDPKIFKPHHLIHAYMMGIPIGPTLIEDTLFILQTTPKLIEAMINFALKVPRARVPGGVKAFGLRCAQSLIDFSQHFYQGLWPGDASLMQLSSIDKATMDSLIKKKKKLPELSQLIKDENREAHLAFLPEDQIKAAAEEIDEFPNIDIKADIFVEEENDIRVGDIVTVKVTLTRMNKDHKDSDFKYLKSNRFPFNEKEKWYVFVGDEKRNLIFMSEVASFGKKTFEKKFLFPADNQGEFGVKVFVRSNGYLGLDYETEVKFKVTERVEKKKYEIHPEDLALKKEPTFFEQLTMGAKPAENDSDEELEDDAKTQEKKDKDIPKDKEKTE